MLNVRWLLGSTVRELSRWHREAFSQIQVNIVMTRLIGTVRLSDERGLRGNAVRTTDSLR